MSAFIKNIYRRMYGLYLFLSFSALKGEYLEPATSSHPIEVVSYEIHPDFITLVKDLDFSGSMDENS